MSPRIDDLREALQEEAGQAPLPSPDATIAGVTARVGRQRRRRMAGLAAVTAAAVAVVGAVVVLGGPDPDATPRPARSSLTSDLEQVRDPMYFPEYTTGLRRLGVVEVPFASPSGATQHRIVVDQAPGAELWAVARCPQDTANDDPGSAAWSEQLTVSVGKTTLPCYGQNLSRTPATPLRVEASPSGWTVSAASHADPLARSGDEPTPSAPKHAIAELAVYESVPWRSYPFAESRYLSRLKDPKTDEGPTDQVVLRRTVTESDGLVTFTVPRPRGGMSLSMSATGPSQLRVTLDGQAMFGKPSEGAIFPTRMLGPEVRGEWLGCWEATGCAGAPSYGVKPPEKSSEGTELTITARVRESSSPDATWTLTFTRDGQ